VRRSTRDRSKRETREALLQAALEQFTAAGFDGPSLDAICAHAGFTRGAFYVHFRNREDLVAAVVERALSRFLDAVITPGDEEGGLEATVERYLAVAAGGFRELGGIEVVSEAQEDAATGVLFHQVLEACGRSARIRERFVLILEGAIARVARAARSGQGAARIRDDVPAAEIANLLVLLALGIRAGVDIGLSLDVEEVRRAVMRLLSRDAE
jgi:AcrR family transcriptional regulator